MKNKYVRGTIFFNKVSSYLHIKNQAGLMVGKTLKWKKAFEQHTSQFGVKFNSFISDKVPFGPSKFIQNVKDKNQTLDFSRTGDHNHNLVSKWDIQTITL